MRIGFFMLAAALMAAPAYAGDPHFTPRPHDGQVVKHDDAGRDVIASHADGSDVSVSYVQMFTSKRPLFTVTMTNLADDAVDISPASVSVVYAMQPVHVYSANELKDIVVGHAKWEKRGVAVMGVVASGIAALGSTTTANTTVYGSNSSFGYTSESSRRVPNAADPDAGVIGADREVAAVKTERDVTLAHIDQTSLQAATLDDDEPHTYKFVIDRPAKLDGSPLSISVTVGNDTHTFDYDVRK